MKKRYSSKEYGKFVGIALIVLGILHLIIPYLDIFWGILIIVAGISALIYRGKGIILMVGILLVLVGFLNIFSTILDFESGGLWLIFGGFQIYWGIGEILRYNRTKENPEYVVKNKIKKEFTWYSLRFAFVAMVLIYLVEVFLGFYFNEALLSSIDILVAMISFFVVITSIINLAKYKQKKFAIISLMISSLIMLLFIGGFIWGFIGVTNMGDFTLEEVEELDFLCSDICYELNGSELYLIDFDYGIEKMKCYCYDLEETLINEEIMLPRI